MAPQAQLFYNDYNLESGAAKTAGALRIVKLVQSYGVKINGVGLQAHLASEVTATADQAAPSRDVLVNTLSSFTALGVDVAYTELDVRFTLPATPAKVQAQAKVFSDVVGSCLAVKRCVGITVWVSSACFVYLSIYPSIHPSIHPIHHETPCSPPLQVPIGPPLTYSS